MPAPTTRGGQSNNTRFAIIVLQRTAERPSMFRPIKIRPVNISIGLWDLNTFRRLSVPGPSSRKRV